MVSVSRAAHNIEITAESLQEDLARLEIQKQALERELAAVVAHLSSVQRALGALQVLLVNSSGAAQAGTDNSAAATVRQPAAPPAPRGKTAPSLTADSAPSDRPTDKEPDAGDSAIPTDTGTGTGTGTGTEIDSQKTYGKLTEQILGYFAALGDVDVRARDVAAALGRDTDSGAINAVRSTLDRLVGTARVRRTGRGLYRRA